MKSKKCSSNQDVPFERYAVQAGVRINLNTPWEEVLHLAVRYEVSKGNVIQLTREMEEDFYYLSQGSICLQILTSNGRENTSNHVHKGCLFNWVKNRINDLPVLFSVGASSLYNKDESWNEAVGLAERNMQKNKEASRQQDLLLVVSYIEAKTGKKVAYKDSRLL